ncbi:leucine--tRNA ligase [Spongiivirga citrea]|uniref:Leucine--tRNA ligase n=1 Tax=Spongiivirga citrea TaxID=1481457 RepID=A0A6M0CMB8_9FLAO|nr:leucine--tRNA ligase [Spongiivirga citrea]NER16969.1 leucine--tRNA ligase [Spongiivirga citrea]
MQYHFNTIEAKWQKHWAENGTFHAQNNSDKPKYYVLDMFPYPSGAGLHVGHPLGYIASDIYARYKRHKGFNVLHPQGYDSFGLPAEQYAIQTGQHPAITTETNIKRYREQLDKIGFSFDWSREVRTSDPSYYKWTQWIFIQLFNSWYDNDQDKARSIDDLVSIFEKEGNSKVKAACDDDTEAFDAATWNSLSEDEKQQLLLKYRLTYLAETEVNWCSALGTVLANDEIVNGVSERGGHPVIRKKMTQWSMRIAAYAQRLLDGLNKIDWPQPLKDSQANWIGRSEGAHVEFRVQSSEFRIGVFTTRPDTIFGVSFMTLAPEHELVSQITTPEQKEAVDAYVEATAKRSERERMADVKTISGVFTGAYAEHPFSKEPIPIWIGDYVLAGYGTGAVMAVPSGDQRDYDFAKHFGIDIPNIFKDIDISEEAFADKDNTVIANSDFLDGLPYKEAVRKAIDELEKIGQGKGKINYRLRDAVFSRQRYWGEPFPVYYKNGLPQMIDSKHLPIELPEVEKYLPTETGEPPLGNATDWAWDTNKNEVVSNDRIDNETVFALELNTMPGWAGSSYYFNRYMDPHNEEAFVSKEAVDYWKEIDLYIGGSEHATGHLLYSRFWQKFLFDRGYLPVDEYAKKLINQGMILGEGAFVSFYRGPYWNSKNSASEGSDFKTILLSFDVVLFIRKHIKFFGTLWLSNPENIASDFDRYKIDGTTQNKILKIYNELNSFAKELGYDAIDWNRNLFQVFPSRVDVSMVNIDNTIDVLEFQKKTKQFKDSKVLTMEDGLFKVSRETEKMSKSKYNVVNPDDICERYGADTLRMYEMFLGPLEQAKPWNTAGITGVHSFLKKMWKLYADDNGVKVTDAEPSKESLKTLHKTIKKVEEDIENFSFNTSVSTFMIAVNELTVQKCRSKAVLEPLCILISPYAPHIAEELWSLLGHEDSISTASFPVFEEKYLVEDSKTYPISFNGKMRFTMDLPLDLSKDDIEAAVMVHEKTKEQLQGRTPKKVIVVPGKIVNIVG